MVFKKCTFRFAIMHFSFRRLYNKAYPSGVGLKNAKIRISQIGGTIEIDSNKNQGTIISISIPIKNEC